MAQEIGYWEDNVTYEEGEPNLSGSTIPGLSEPTSPYVLRDVVDTKPLPRRCKRNQNDQARGSVEWQI